MIYLCRSDTIEDTWGEGGCDSIARTDPTMVFSRRPWRPYQYKVGSMLAMGGFGEFATSHRLNLDGDVGSMRSYDIGRSPFCEISNNVAIQDCERLNIADGDKWTSCD